MFFVGVDIGKRRDHTAIAVVERIEQPRPYGEALFRHLEVRYVKRLPLGTPFALAVEFVQNLVNDPALLGQCVVAADATGLGGPVVEMMTAARLGCEVDAVTITGGEKATQRGRDWSVPKRDLMSGIEVLLERGELKIARGLEDAEALVRELGDMKATATSATGRMRYGAEGAGEHDDLAIALALAVWRAMRTTRKNGFGTGPLF